MCEAGPFPSGGTIVNIPVMYSGETQSVDCPKGFAGSVTFMVKAEMLSCPVDKYSFLRLPLLAT